MSVLPSRTIFTPSPWSTNSTSGNAAPPCETRYAGPLSGFLNTGVWTIPSPITEPSSQLAGLALKTASRHAFWIVVSRDGSTPGIVKSTLWMFAWPMPGDSTVTAKVVPSSLLPWPTTEAVSFGANGRLAQLDTTNG